MSIRIWRPSGSTGNDDDRSRERRATAPRSQGAADALPIPVLKRLVSHYTGKYGLEVVASESFSGSDSVLYPALGQELARDAIARTDRPEIEVFIVPGGNFPTMPFISDWERAVGKPVITTNQAALWAMIQINWPMRNFPASSGSLRRCPRSDTACHRSDPGATRSSSRSILGAFALTR